MRVAHWTFIAANRSGMYETAKELCLAQRALGLDCGLIDAFDPKTQQCDGDLKTETYHYADGADLYVLHSHVPEPWMHDGTPIIVMLHGMPHYSWETELYMQEGGNQSPFSQLMAYFNDIETIARFVTLWSPQLTTWDILDDYRGRTRFAPNGIDLGRYTPDGPKKSLAGNPKLLVADQARMCKDPFFVVMGAEWFRAHHEPEARLTMVGMPPIGGGNRVRERWEHLLENSGCKRVVAQRYGILPDLEKHYRDADILLSVTPDESRVYKEAIACGCDVVSPYLNTAQLTEEWLDLPHGDPAQSRDSELGRYMLPRAAGHLGAHALVERERTTPIWETINPVDAALVADQIAKTWEVRRRDPEGRRRLLAEFARKRYDMRETAAGMIDIYAEVLRETGKLPIIGHPSPGEVHTVVPLMGGRAEPQAGLV